jgi:hypothetical protein
MVDSNTHRVQYPKRLAVCQRRRENVTNYAFALLKAMGSARLRQYAISITPT